MLVLSRRPDEKILLPTVPAILKVISSQAGLVRIGIKAPPHVPILREELCRGERALSLSGAVEGNDILPPSPDLRCLVRNCLNNLVLGLTLLQMHLVDCHPAVRQTLEGMEKELQALHHHLAAPADEGTRPAGEPIVSPDAAPV
jgi:carbon storage regulator CsrA